LHKFALAWNGLKLDATHLAFVVDTGPNLGWTDVAALPWQEQAAVNFDGCRRLTEAADLQVSLFTVDESLFGLMEAAQSAATDPTFVLGDYLAQISEWSAWSLADLTYLAGPSGFNLSLPSAMQDERPFVALRKAFGAFRRAGVTAEQAHSWTVVELGYAETQSIKQALSLSYPTAGWLDILGTLQDELRSLRRDALLGHLLNTLGYEDSTEFYDHYLIDPEQAPCAKTSRMVEAHAAVQTFAQRILLNLEPFAFTREDAEAMAWRKRYRLWEAAREVFLFPENWLFPEVRDNKSVFFQELEDGVMQDDVTLDTAERLYSEYLCKLDQVSRLEMMGMYQDERDDGTSTLHVFGRTTDVPHLYFYRRWEDQARWTPWERVDLDIQSDHLIPIVYNGRLYVFWPDFKLTELEEDQTTQDNSQQIDQLNAEIGVLQGEMAAIEKDPTILNTIGELSVAAANALLEDPKLNDQLRTELEDWLSYRSQLAKDQGELEDLQSPPSPPKYQIDLGMAWSWYQDQAWAGKKQTTTSFSYKTNSDPIDHFFTGWISSGNQLRVSVDTRTNEDSIDGALLTHLGYFYLDDCRGELLNSDDELSRPLGEIFVTLASQEFQRLPPTRLMAEGRPS
jgi:Neuraminidase-like domain